jgi:hypothetical protein
VSNAIALENDDAHELQSQAIDGDKHMRQGAAYTYSMYLQRPYWRATCEHHLLTLMHDSDLEVRRNVTLSFSYMKPEDITENTPFILALIDSPTLPVAIRELADYIKPMSFIEYELSLEITEKIVEMLRTTQSREFGWEDVVSLPLAVYNRSRDLNIQHRAMNLFDDLVKLNIGAAKDALKQWDRDRRIDY